MKTSEVLINARELIITKGWIQGNYHSANGYDLTGALSYGTPTTNDSRKPFWDALEHVAGMLGTKEYMGISDWNDKPKRTLPEVLEILDRAIEDMVKVES